MNYLNKLFFAGLAVSAASLQAASFNVDYQNTVASEQYDTATGDPNYVDFGDVGEGNHYHISVNPNNAGYGSYIALDPSGNVVGPYVRSFTDPVVGWSFIGGNTAPNVVEESGGLVTWSSTDSDVNGFGQAQRKFWNATDPGAGFNIPTNQTEETNTTEDSVLTGYRSLSDAQAIVDISSLASGTLTAFYADFGGTPSVSAIMRDTDGIESDLLIGDLHLNGDGANRAEHYVAEMDFINDAGYDQIIFDFVSGNGNARAPGVVLTGVVPEPSAFALLAGMFGLTWVILRRR